MKKDKPKCTFRKDGTSEICRDGKGSPKPDKILHLVLEKRYLCFESWEKIAVDMNYDITHIHRLHNLGLKETSKLIKSCHEMS